MICCGPRLTLATLLTGMFFSLTGVVLKIFLPDAIGNAILRNLILSNTAAHYNTWVEPPIVMYTKYYLFNYTNSEEFFATWKINGTKPRVQQIGPYVYRQSRRKTNVTFSESNEEVEFYVTKEFTFVPELSNGTEEDLVTFPNVVLRAVAHSPKTRAEPWKTAGLFMAGISAYPFLTQAVGELLFKGYYDEIIATAREYAEEETGFTSDYFSLMKNSTESGPVKVKTGRSGMSEYGQVVEFNNQKVLEVWPADSKCNEIKGSDGSMFPPHLPTDERLYIFAGEMCRSMFLRFEREVDHYGVKANRFSLDPATLSNTEPDYECFCKSSINKCWGAGVFNVGQCRNDSQILMSLPHFYNTDYHIKNAIDGLMPDPEKHVFFIDIEPTTGIPLNVSTNMQLNIAVEHTPWIGQTNNLPEIVLPLLWMSDGIDLNETMTAMLKSKVIDGPWMISFAIPLLLVAFGLLTGFLGIFCSVYYMFRTNKRATVQPISEKTKIHAFSY